MRFRKSSLAFLALLLIAAIGGVPADEHALDENGVQGSSPDVQEEGFLSAGSSEDAAGTEDEEEEYPPQVAPSCRIKGIPLSELQAISHRPARHTRAHSIGPASQV